MSPVFWMNLFFYILLNLMVLIVVVNYMYINQKIVEGESDSLGMMEGSLIWEW